MRLPSFEYLEPKTLAEACSLLKQKDTKLIAGGTELLVKMKQKLLTPKTLVNIKKIANLNYISYKHDEGLEIGAASTLHSIANSPVVRERFSILAQAAVGVGKPRIPYMATIGGNICLDSRCFYHNQSHLWKPRLACYKDGGDVCYVVKGGNRCHALFMADTVPAMIALGAKVQISGLDGEKQSALEELYTGKGEKPNSLKPGQILTKIQVTSPPPHTGGFYLKYSLREAIDFAIVGVGVVITLKSEDGACSDARIVLGSVGMSPVRAVKAEEALRGGEIDDKLVEIAAQVALKEVHPVTHMGIPASYKRKIVQTLTKQAIRQAWQKAKSA